MSLLKFVIHSKFNWEMANQGLVRYVDKRIEETSKHSGSTWGKKF